MKKALSIFMLITVGTTLAHAGDIHPLGLKWKDPRVAAPDHEVKITGSKDILPVRVDHSADMPPVGNQAGQGSCTAWATAYYHKSYQEWVEHGWPLSDQNHQFSPAFVYNQINGGGDYGSWFGDAFQLLCDMGSSSMALSPYNDADCISWPSEAAYDSAMPYRSDQWYWFDLNGSLGIEGVKQCLADGNNVVIGLLVYANYDNIASYNNVFCVSDLSGDIRGGHANCIVGYDDSLETHDGRGAFRVVNSWGTSWGDEGYYWMSYQAATDSRTSYQAAFYSSDRIGYQPTLKMRARIDHANRGSIRIKTGIGPSSAPYWEREFYVNSYDGYMFGGGNNPFPENNIVFDISEGAASLDSLDGNNVYLMTQDLETDGVSGTVEYLGAESVPWGTGNSSLETPKPIEDDYGNHYTNITLHYRDFALSVNPPEISLEQGDSIHVEINLGRINGFDHSVRMSSLLAPTPAAGSVMVEFEKANMIPDDSCMVSIIASPGVSPGKYRIVISGTDSLYTLIRSDTLTLWILGFGEVLCVGSTPQMFDLAGTRWNEVDSISCMPPVIGNNYHALILENNLTMADTSKIRAFIAGGGRIVSIGRSAMDLSGGTNLLPVSKWLGAGGYAWYTGAGINMISDYQNPFGVSGINYGDILGTLTANNGRLGSLQPGAVTLAHLGTVVSAIASVYNQYEAGQSLWITVGAGYCPQIDSLITGFLGNPVLGVIGDQTGDLPFIGNRLTLSAYPMPCSGKSTFRLNIPGRSYLNLALYDICGRRVKTLFDGNKPAGLQLFSWDGRDDQGRQVSAGIYFIKAETAYGKILKKILSVN